MIGFTSTGSTDQTEAWLNKLAKGDIYRGLERFGQMGVDALVGSTPVDEATTANSWYYEIVQDSKSWSIIWGNSNVNDGQVIAILLQYGHGTGTGGYVQGRDYINPALKPIFDQILSEAWKVVTSG